MGRPSTAKTAKIGSLENFRLYGIMLSWIMIFNLAYRTVKEHTLEILPKEVNVGKKTVYIDSYSSASFLQVMLRPEARNGTL